MQSEYIVNLVFSNWNVTFRMFVQSNQDGLNATVESLDVVAFSGADDGFLDFTDRTVGRDSQGNANPTYMGITRIKSTQDLVQLLSYKPTASISVSKILVPGYTDLTGILFDTLDDVPAAKTIQQINSTDSSKTTIYQPVAVGTQDTYFIFIGDPTNVPIGTQLFVINDAETFYIPSTYSGTIYAGYYDYTVVNGVVTAQVID